MVEVDERALERNRLRVRIEQRTVRRQVHAAIVHVARDALAENELRQDPVAPEHIHARRSAIVIRYCFIDRLPGVGSRDRACRHLIPM